MAEQTPIQNQNAGTTPGAQNNNAQQNNNQPVQGTVIVTANNGQQQGAAPAGSMAINLDPVVLAQLLNNSQVQAGLANGQTVAVGNQQQQQQMMQNLAQQGVQVPGTTPVAPQIPGTAAPAQNPQQPAEKPGFFARIKDGVLQFIIKHSGWFIIITVASTALITLGCVYLYNKYFGNKTTTQVVADNNRKFNEQRDMIVRENNALVNRDNYQKVGLGTQTSVAKSLCMRLY